MRKNKIMQLPFSFCLGLCIICLLCAPHYLVRSYVLAVVAAVLSLVVFIHFKWDVKLLCNCRKEMICAGVFIFTCVFSIIWAEYKMNSLVSVMTYAAGFAFCAYTYISLCKESSLEKLGAVLYVVAIVSSVYAMYQRYTGVSADASLTDVALNSGMPGRVYSFYDNPNNFAEILVLIIPVSFSFVLSVRKRAAKIALGVFLLLPIISLVMTYSRSAWIGAAVATVIFALAYGGIYVMRITLSAIALYPFLPSSVTNRVLTIGSLSDSSNMYRVHIWSGTLRIIGENYLCGVGVGAENFALAYAEKCSPVAEVAAHSHMLILQLLTETGYIGASAFLLFLCLIIIELIAKIRKNDADKIWAASCLSSLLGILAVSLFEHVLFYPRVMLTFFIICGFSLGIVKKDLSEKDKSFLSVESENTVNHSVACNGNASSDITGEVCEAGRGSVANFSV